MKNSKICVLALFLTILGCATSRAQNLGNLLGGDLGGTVGNLLEGVFSSSNITVADMAGEWHATGPAVCFQSEDFLKKAGGEAMAAGLESKMAPYYEKYGLNNATLTVDQAGNFSLATKLITLKGTITQKAGAQPGVFEFNFTILGKKIAGVTTYVQKTSTSMDVMFDASKLKSLLAAVGSITNISIVQTFSSLLDSYKGLCIGFNFKGTSTNNSGIGGVLNGLIGGGSSSGTPSSGSSSGSSVGNGLGNLLNGLVGGSSNSGNGNTRSETEENKTSTEETNTNTNTNSNNNSNSNNSVGKSLNALKGLLGN